MRRTTKLFHDIISKVSDLLVEFWGKGKAIHPKTLDYSGI
jgi:hypothetical protein